MRIIGNDPSVPRQTQEVASGTLPNGKPVVVNADGTVSVVAETSISQNVGSEQTFANSDAGQLAAAFDSSNNKAVIVYRDESNSNYGTSVVVSISGDTLSYGTPVVFNSGYADGMTAAFDSSNNKVVVSYADWTSSGHGTSRVGTVSGTSISYGTAVKFESGSSANYSDSIFDSTNNKIVIVFRKSSSSHYPHGIVGTVSGTSISFGSATQIAARTLDDNASLAFDSTNGKVIVVYRNNTTGYANVGTVSSTSISFGSETTWNVTSTPSHYKATFDSTNNRIVVAFRDNGNSYYGTAIVGTVSGTSISFGNEYVFEAANAQQTSIGFDSNAGKVVISYQDGGNGQYGTLTVGTVNDTAITFGTPVVFHNSGAISGVQGGTVTVFDSNVNKILNFYRYGGDDRIGGIVFTNASTSQNLTSENYIGMSGGPAFQTGSAASVGSDVVFASASTNQIASAFDSNSNRIVIAYRDNGNSNQGTAIVGTISGSSISFGSEVVFNSGNTSEISMTFYDDTNRVIIAYKDAGNSDYGTAIVGSVDSSDNSISFGTETVFESAHTTFTSVVEDSNADKVVICYNDVGNSNQGTAIVGTISGTSISFGSPNTFESGTTERISTTFDSNSNKFVVAYADGGDSNKGKAIVGTVSGTGTSFGSIVEFESGTVNSTTMTFDSSNNKVVIAIRGSSDVGKAYVGTVSGTSISFGSAVDFTSGSNDNRLAAAVFDTSVNKVVIAFVNSNTSISGISGTVSGTSISFDDITTVKTGNNLDNLTAAFDSNANKVFIGYRDVNSSNHGTANIFTTNTVATTRGQVADGDHALVDTQGAISDNQIGLTAGQSYYVQIDGTIGTTAADPSVFAGTAVSATKLIVKG